MAEAMALQKPVVAVNSAGPAELIEDGVSGFLVAPGEPGAVAAATLRLAADAVLAQRIGRAARHRVTTHFSAAACAGRIENVYRTLAGRRRAKGG